MYFFNLPKIRNKQSAKRVVISKMLRLGYLSPNRKSVTGKLLDTVTEQLSEHMKVDLNGCANATSIQDGWSNIHNESVIATCLLVDDKSYLIVIMNDIFLQHFSY